jgi:CobQ-like glutamine amidotransferase family enzyme
MHRRCQQRGIELRVVGLGIGDALAPDEYDMLFIGGGQDKEEIPIAQDLHDIKGIGLWAAIEDNMPVLAVCGGYQLLAHYYRPANGPDVRGLGVFDAWTVHKGARVPRCIGDVAISWNGGTLVGFENHGGRTYLGTARPLGKVLKGYGNNSEDATEGAIYRNAYGTYMHGSLLPKNPHFADHLIELALRRKYDSWATAETETGEVTNGTPSPDGDNEPSPLLTPLDDTLEWEAHISLLEKLGLHNEALATWQAHNLEKVS